MSSDIEKHSGTEASVKVDWNIANMYAYQAGGINSEKNNNNKLEEFKERIKPFKNVSTLEEAKELAERILPVKFNINRFRIGNAECIVVNKPDLFRICVNTEDEFISYDFS